MSTQKERDERRQKGLLIFHRKMQGNGRRLVAAARHKRALAEQSRRQIEQSPYKRPGAAYTP